VGDIVPFRKGCEWNHGGACLAKSPFACICWRPAMIKVARKPSPHSPYHTSLLMPPDRDADCTGATPEQRAVEYAEIIEALSETDNPIDYMLNELPPERISRIKARAAQLIAEEVERRDLIAFAESGGPIIE
jgi:hypothetical protein